MKRVTVDALSGRIDACLHRDDIRLALEQMHTACPDSREFEAVLRALASVQDQCPHDIRSTTTDHSWRAPA